MKTEGQARFDGRAAGYDQSPHQATFFKPLHELALREAEHETPHPQAVLDIGCGTGQFLLRAAVMFPEAKLVGVDESAAMVDIGQASVPSHANMRFLHAPAETLPLADSSFDLAVTTASFHHWADQCRGLAEVYRVLRPGGILVLGDVMATGLLRFRPLAWLVSRIDAGRFNRPEVLDGILKEAGFRIIRRTAVPRWAKVVQVIVACRCCIGKGGQARLLTIAIVVISGGCRVPYDLLLDGCCSTLGIAPPKGTGTFFSPLGLKNVPVPSL